MRELSKDLVDVALAEKYMGERIPEAWLKMEQELVRYILKYSIQFNIFYATQF